MPTHMHIKIIDIYSTNALYCIHILDDKESTVEFVALLCTPAERGRCSASVCVCACVCL